MHPFFEIQQNKKYSHLPRSYEKMKARNTPWVENLPDSNLIQCKRMRLLEKQKPALFPNMGKKVRLGGDY